VTEHQEPSYYEIALTNRQVLVAFVILLACVMASFFAGVWVGKGSPAAAAAADAPPAEPEPTPAGGTPEELSFFTDGENGGRPDLGELAAKPRPETTLAQDLGVERPAATATPRAATPVPSPAARATEAPARPSPPPEAAADAAPAALAPGEVVIQVFSSRDEGLAKRLVTQLKAAGFSAFLSPAGAMYRVRIGPFTDRRQAEAVAERARRDFKVDTWITAAP
jgi:cell division septation protein DedD